MRDSNLHIVDWDKAPTPGNFKLARAFPTSAWVTPVNRESGQNRKRLFVTVSFDGTLSLEHENASQ